MLAQKSGINEYKAPYAPETTAGKWYEWAFPDMDAIPDVGYSVYGLEVTETFNPQSGMLGVRVAAPHGFPIKAIAQPGESVTVTCSESPDYGLVATMESPSLGLSWLAGHLAKCNEGEHRAGDVIGRVRQDRGSQEGGLYWQQMNQGQPEAPEVGYLWWTFLGKEPNFKR